MKHPRRTRALVAAAGLLMGLSTALLATPALASTGSSVVPASQVQAAAPATQEAQEVYLGHTRDQCSGNLYVKNRHDDWVFIPRGQLTEVEVAVNGAGYWYWKCGSSGERSRGDSDWRARVKLLKVLHSTSSRQIDWWCYDLQA